jgi:hypothetical protein
VVSVTAMLDALAAAVAEGIEEDEDERLDVELAADDEELDADDDDEADADDEDEDEEEEMLEVEDWLLEADEEGIGGSSGRTLTVTSRFIEPLIKKAESTV